MKKMEKVKISLIRVVGLVLLLSFVFSSSQASAATVSDTRENEISASRYVEVVLIIPAPYDDEYYYEDDLGYRGTIPEIDSEAWFGGQIRVTYGGTVHCEGTCPIPPQKLIDDK